MASIIYVAITKVQTQIICATPLFWGYFLLGWTGKNWYVCISALSNSSTYMIIYSWCLFHYCRLVFCVAEESNLLTQIGDTRAQMKKYSNKYNYN